jgi:hypothetical protein
MLHLRIKPYPYPYPYPYTVRLHPHPYAHIPIYPYTHIPIYTYAHIPIRYLNYNPTWQHVYSYEPYTDLSKEQQELVVGGEIALWGEYVDDHNLLTSIFPR